MARRIFSSEMLKRNDKSSSVSVGVMVVSTQPDGAALQLGKRETAGSESASLSVSEGGVGVPEANGMAGSGVLVGVAFRLLMAETLSGDGSSCRCRPSACAKRRAAKTVKMTPAVSSKWVRQLL